MNLLSERLTAEDYDEAVELFYTVTIVWDNFENAARTQARIQDCADLALTVIPHRKGGENADDQRRKAEAALTDVVAKLVQPI